MEGGQRSLEGGGGEVKGELAHLFIRRPALVIGVAFLVYAPEDIIMIKNTDD